ncbi:MAG: hypothetical protein IV094_26575 [Vitreoscilla sp.]|nr:hypothetical protein [Vitreoscilla sp.]
MNPHIHALGRLVLLTTLATMVGAALGAPRPADRPDWSALVDALRDGRLDAATAELARLRSAAAPQAAVNRVERIMAQRTADSQWLTSLAERDLDRSDLSAALRRLDLASQLDRRTLDTQVMARAAAAQAELDAALAVLDGCRLKRDVTCMKAALMKLRQLDRFNADAVLAELAAEDWYGGESPRRERVDAPAVGR